MNNNFKNLENIFEELDGTQKVIEPGQTSSFDSEFEQQSEFKTNSPQHITKELIDYYIARPDLLERDIESGIIPDDVVNDLRNIVFAYSDIEKENPPKYGSGEGDDISNGKALVKSTKAGKLLVEKLNKPREIGFVEPLLLGLVVSSLGLLYLGYLYIVI